MSEILKKLGEVLEDRKTKDSSESYVASIYKRVLEKYVKKLTKSQKS